MLGRATNEWGPRERVVGHGAPAPQVLPLSLFGREKRATDDTMSHDANVDNGS